LTRWFTTNSRNAAREMIALRERHRRNSKRYLTGESNREDWGAICCARKLLNLGKE
jgi:hypothetical protein